MDTEEPIANPILESNGTLRTIGSILCSIGGIATVIPNPVISVWGWPVMYLGAVIGGAGCIRAVAQGTLFNLEKRED